MPDMKRFIWEDHKERKQGGSPLVFTMNEVRTTKFEAGKYWISITGREKLRVEVEVHNFFVDITDFSGRKSMAKSATEYKRLLSLEDEKEEEKKDEDAKVDGKW